MARTLFDVISVDRLRRKARSPGSSVDALALLAKTVTEILDARGPEDAEEAFMNTMRDYFYNVSASAKRRYADAIAIAFCDDRDKFDGLWKYLKEKGVAGKTYTTAKRRRST